MADRYSVIFTDTNTDNTTHVGITGAAGVRPGIYEIIVGSRATPADHAANYEFQRYTVSGTSTSATPVALDPGSPAAETTAGTNHTGEPTYTANEVVLQFPVNQRATFRWVAVPGGELLIPAASDNGIGMLSDTPTSAFAIHGTVFFEE